MVLTPKGHGRTVPVVVDESTVGLVVRRTYACHTEGPRFDSLNRPKFVLEFRLQMDSRDTFWCSRVDPAPKRGVLCLFSPI